MGKNENLQIELSVQITAAPTQVIAAFFDPVALATWWNVVRSVTAPRPMGIYAIEWAATPLEDEVLGPLRGIFYGTVMEFRNGKEFFLADAYWLPPEGPPIGPMALEVSCQVDGPATRLCVRQSSADTGARWQRYWKVITAGWKESLGVLKEYLEEGAEPRLPSRGLTSRH